MKVLVIPDVHLKINIFDQANKVNTQKYDNIVCLGDLVDDWNQQWNLSLYESTLERVLSFDKEHPDMLWCWGNHDFSYRYAFQESGFSYQMIPTVNRYLEKLINQAEDRFKVIHKIDTTLFSHAGLTTEYVRYFLYKKEPKNVEQIMKKIETLVYDREKARLLWKDCSPIWARPQTEHYIDDMYKQDTYFQVVGHTPVKKPLLKDNVLTLDTFSTYSDGTTPIGDCRFVIIDTITHEWTYAD